MGLRAVSLLFVSLLLAVEPALASRSVACASYRRKPTTKTFLSAPMFSRPGDVNHKFHTIGAPTGHFVTVDFAAEFVYANGDPVLLSDVYLHHWNMLEVVTPVTEPETEYFDKEMEPMWTMGGESRILNCSMPSPYGLVSGGDGVRTRWIADIHGIDLRGTGNPLACTECLCSLYTGNITNLPEGYVGGLQCCVDESRCKLRDGFNGDDPALELVYHLKLTWTYEEYSECVVPLTQMRIDVTATPENPHGFTEYDVEGYCKPKDFEKPECIDVKEVIVESKLGGDMVYAISHLHTYSLGATLYGEDDRIICHMAPIYGHGEVASNENGYVVGITHCNPSFGPNSLGKIRKGEKLRYQAKYSKVDGPHTGVMALTYTKIDEGTKAITTPDAALSVNRKIMS